MSKKQKWHSVSKLAKTNFEQIGNKVTWYHHIVDIKYYLEIE